MLEQSDLLNYQFHQLKQSPNSPTMVFMHGLFGDMNNLGIIARAFAEDYSILRIDLRNHGHSFHADEMNYQVMAEDVLRLLEHLQLSKVILVGHSMGGKTAMKAAALQPDIVERLVVIDIAPVAYQHDWHNDVFQGLFAVKAAQSPTRQAARSVLAQYIDDDRVIQFILKSFAPEATEKFRFFSTALFRNYQKIMDWEPVFFDKKTLFIKGGLSNYILPEYSERILAQFPRASSFTIAGCRHWVHAEKPDLVARAIKRFLALN
ncbi:alpha/beta fold hydrolase [Pasteurellaceae bacterium LIM206]|nr:alpha/beta fold hydrolase [Pasteurellaceae bacterium LIM206]